MKTTLSLPLVAAALALGAAAWAPRVGTGPGDRLPEPSLANFKQTSAESYGDFAGRAVLIEFFEHW